MKFRVRIIRVRSQSVITIAAAFLILATIGCAPYPVTPDVSRTEDVSLDMDNTVVTWEPRFILRKFAEAVREAHDNIEIVDSPALLEVAIPKGKRRLREVLQPDACRRIAEQLNVTYLVLIGSLYAHEGELEGPFVIFIGAWGVAKQELEARFGATVIELSSGEPLCEVTAEADATMVAAGWFFPFVVGPWAEDDLNTIKGVAEEVGKAIVDDANSESVRIVVMAGAPVLEETARRIEAKEERIDMLLEQAEADDPEAQLQLYYVEYWRDRRASLKWLCRAADQGQRHAQSELAREYEMGSDIIERDLVQAYVWYSLALRGGAEEYRSRLVELAATMTPEQAEESEHRLNTWVAGQCEQELLPADSGDDISQ